MVTHKENLRNQKLTVRSATGYNGVRKHKDWSGYSARIMVDGKEIWLGASKKLKDVIDLRAAADIKYNFHPNHGKKRSAPEHAPNF